MEFKAIFEPARKACKVVAKKAAPVMRKLYPVAPDIMMVSGIALTVGGTVVACVKTARHIPAIKDGFDAEMGLVEDGESKTRLYLQTAGKVAKVYALPFAMVGSGVLLTVGAHNEQTKRIALLTTAYNSLYTSFNEYRARVVESEGTDKDMLYLHGEREETVVEQKETKSGKITEKEKQVKVFGSGDGDDLYKKCFSIRTSTQWRNDPDYNLQFVKSCERVAEQKFKAEGHLFLDEVYEMLGFDLEGHSNAKIVGWIDDGTGTKHVDFRIFCPDSPWDVQAVNRAALKGDKYYDSEIYLDLNCDGIIIDRI